MIQTNQDQIFKFCQAIQDQAPSAAQIFSLRIEHHKRNQQLAGFSILPSQNEDQSVTQVSPDIAVCSECLEDIKRQSQRKHYFLINCTHCGPRFSIIESLPYDRQNTTMKDFKLCRQCMIEYLDVNDRRFHAQPVACHHCGPAYHLTSKDVPDITDQNKVLLQSVQWINQGQVLLIKGLGGYQLVCNALDHKAVEELKDIKKRQGKPLAVMFRDLSSLNKYAIINDLEKEWLISWHRPIVLLSSKDKITDLDTNGLKTIGAILPYMPFHYLLFEKLETDALVFTSGNLSDEPIIIEDDQAFQSFHHKVKAIVTYNRLIHNRCDDSILQVVQNQTLILRRSRGFAPAPIYLNLPTEGIIAAGAELAGSFALGKQNQVILSQYQGDLKNYETYHFYRESYSRFKSLFRFEPSLAVCDLHPDYLSTRFAQDIDVPYLPIQHHHAHLASAMAEHGWDETVVGVVFDGTGYGTDGQIWGGEFMVADLENFERINHLAYLPLPGGDQVVKEPWRMAVAYLAATFGDKWYDLGLDWFNKIHPFKLKLIQELLIQEKSFQTSSMGRLFDAVAAILNICLYAKYQAEAPMLLENTVKESSEVLSYSYELNTPISLLPAIREIVDDLKKGVHTGNIAARFHQTIVNMTVEQVKIMSEIYSINKVVLSGGSFQNKYLYCNIVNKLKKLGLEVITNNLIPINDGGIALGQLAIAAKLRSTGKLQEYVFKYTSQNNKY